MAFEIVLAYFNKSFRYLFKGALKL